MDYQILGVQIYHRRLLTMILYKIYDILVGSALDVFGKKLIYTNVSKKKKCILRNHGWHKIAPRKFRRAKKVYKHFGGDVFNRRFVWKERL